MVIVRNTIILIEYRKHTLKMITGATLKIRYLHYNTIVSKTLYKRIGYTLFYATVVIVQIMTAHIYHRLLQVAQLMSQYINRDNRQSELTFRFLLNISLIKIMRTQILAEAQCFCSQPRLLQFYKHKLLFTLVVYYLSRKIYAEDRNTSLLQIAVLITSHLNLSNLPFQKSRQQNTCHTVIL